MKLDISDMEVYVLPLRVEVARKPVIAPTCALMSPSITEIPAFVIAPVEANNEKLSRLFKLCTEANDGLLTVVDVGDNAPTTVASRPLTVVPAAVVNVVLPIKVP